MDRSNTYHTTYKTIQGREPTHTTLFTKRTHTHYLQCYSGERTNIKNIIKKLFKEENQHLPHYLQNYLRKRANIYHIIYKLFKGENQHLPHYLQTI
jgi:predicted transcriptional regulator